MVTPFYYIGLAFLDLTTYIQFSSYTLEQNTMCLPIQFFIKSLHAAQTRLAIWSLFITFKKQRQLSKIFFF